MALTPEQEKRLADIERIVAEQTAIAERATQDFPPIKEIMHPDISNIARFNLQNLADIGDERSKAEFLKKHFPNLQYKILEDRLAIKRPEEKEWKRLDPSGLGPIGSDYSFKDPAAYGEILRDLADVAWEAGPEAALQGSGATLGVGLGAATKNPFLAILGASAGGAGGTYVSEKLRKLLAGYAGIPTSENVNRGAVALGGLTPPIIGKNFLKGDMLQHAEGLPSMTTRLTGKIIGKTAGIPPEIQKNYIKRGMELNRLVDSGELANTVENFQKDFIGNFIEHRQDIGKRYAEEATKNKGLVSTVPIKEKLNNVVAKMEASPYITKGDREVIDGLKQEIVDILSPEQEVPVQVKVKDPYTGVETTRTEMQKKFVEVPDTVPPTTAWDMRMKMRALRNPSFVEKLSNKMKEKYAAALDGALRESEQHIDNTFDSFGETGKLREEYTRIKDLERALDSGPLLDARGFYRTMANLDSPDKMFVKKTIEDMKKAGVKVPDVDQLSLDLKTINMLHDPSFSAVGSGGTTSTSRTIEAAMLGKALGGAAAAVGIPPSLANYAAQKTLTRGGYTKAVGLEKTLRNLSEKIPFRNKIPPYFGTSQAVLSPGLKALQDALSSDEDASQWNAEQPYIQKILKEKQK